MTAVQRSLDENLDLDAAFARVRQARATAASSGAQLLPPVDFDVSRTYEHQSLNGAFGSVANGSPGFHRDGHEDVIGPSANWAIDLFGGLRRQDVPATALGSEIAQRHECHTKIQEIEGGDPHDQSSSVSVA